MNNSITVAFFSDYLNHHQASFCKAMINRLGDNFKFIATEGISDFRLKLGYNSMDDAPYVIAAYRNDNEYQKALDLGYESDVVIWGSASDVFIKKRVADNKITLKYSERFFKKARWRFDPRVWVYRYKSDICYRNKNLFMLCAGAYTAPDCRFIFSYPNKTYKWVYFP